MVNEAVPPEAIVCVFGVNEIAIDAPPPPPPPPLEPQISVWLPPPPAAVFAAVPVVRLIETPFTLKVEAALRVAVPPAVDDTETLQDGWAAVYVQVCPPGRVPGLPIDAVAV